MKNTPKNIVDKRNVISTLSISVFMSLLLLGSLVLADNPYKPYLHKASVPEHPKISLYGSYATDLFPGAATYSYPIEVPPGTNGLSPFISITYNSQTVEQRPGILGAGWKITENYIYRDVNSTLDDTSDDSFKLILDGTSYELVYVPTDNFYHTKIETFIRIQYLTGASNTYGSYWLVTLRDGTKYRFGFNQDSELTSNTGRNYALKWSLDLIEDTHDNKVFYSYLEDPNSDDIGAVYLSEIEYNNDRRRKIQFSYESTNRPDIRTVYELGNLLCESRRLTDIDVFANDGLVRKYSFEYTDLNPEKSLTSISKIKYLGSDGTSLFHQIAFEYYPSFSGFTKQTTEWVSPTGFSYESKDQGTRLIDINRDGFVDIVKSRQKTNEKKVWINDGVGGWIDSTSSWSLPVWITTYDESTAKRYYEFREFNSGYGLRRETCPLSYNGDSVDGCEIYRNDVLEASIEPGEEWIMCYWGDSTNYKNMNCCNGTTMYINSFESIGCCEPGKYWQQPDGYPMCSGDSSHYYPNKGGEFSYYPYFYIGPHILIEPDNGVRFVDFNNDGFVDILHSTEKGRGAWMNSGNGWIDVSGQWSPPIDFVKNDKDQGVQTIDFDGDGKVDILQSIENSETITKKAFKNSGSGWVDVSSSWEAPVVFLKDGKDTGVRIEEINGDGLQDILLANGTTRKAWLNTGSSWVESYLWIPPSSTNFITENRPDTGVRFADLNNDGLTDILEDYANGSTTDRGAWINNGHSWTYNSVWQSPEPFTKDGKNIGRRLADVNGDGFSDIVVAFSDSGGYHSWSWIRNQNTPFMLKKITNEIGGLTSVNYKPSTSFDNTGDDSLSDLGFNVWVVDGVTNDNAMTDDFKVVGVTYYDYYNGMYDYNDFEFRGFEKVKEILPDNNYINHYFHQDNDRKSREHKIEVYDSNGNIFLKVEGILDVINTNGCSNILLTSQRKYLYDGFSNNPKISKVSYDYDSFGNVIEIVLHGDINVSGDEKYENYFYTTNITSWIVDRLGKYQVFSSDSSKFSEISFFYDNKGDKIQTERWINPGTGQRYKVKYDYDNYGNIKTITDPLGRISSFDYGIRDTTFTYPDSYINALSQKTDYMYDLGTGNLLWYEMSGVRNSFYYDVFGRINKEVQPPDTYNSPTKTYTYVPDAVSPTIIKVAMSPELGEFYDVYNYYDGFGNLIQFKKPSEDNKQIVNNFFYDGVGRIIKQQNPYFDLFLSDLSTPSMTVDNTKYIYDPLGRVVSIINPDGTNKTITFNRNIVTIYDENQYRNTYSLDAYDRVTKILEYNNNPQLNQNFETETYVTQYSYDVANNIVNIFDNLGNEYYFDYDSLGRKIYSSDPDLGNLSYAYDLVGNLVSEHQIGSGNIVTGDGYYREYDALNQLIRIRNGTTPTSPIIETYSYDPFGQRIKIERNDLANTKIYTPFKEFMRIVNSSGVYDFTYIYQDETLVSRINPEENKNFYHPDHLGSTSLITNENGGIVENTFYGPYGEVLSGGEVDIKLYTGQIADRTNQYYYTKRYYKPQNAQFIQPDKIITQRYNPQNLNRYSYVYNNPYKYTDPTGQCIWDLCVAETIAISAFASFTIISVIPMIPQIVGQIQTVVAPAVNTITGIIFEGMNYVSNKITGGLDFNIEPKTIVNPTSPDEKIKEVVSDVTNKVTQSENSQNPKKINSDKGGKEGGIETPENSLKKSVESNKEPLADRKIITKIIHRRGDVIVEMPWETKTNEDFTRRAIDWYHDLLDCGESKRFYDMVNE